ncbi:MAG: HAD family hydrolase, partial [Candidatus Heimdallarchaeota archaeon]
MKNKIPVPVKDTFLIFDLHGVLTSKVEMGKQYDEFVANFLVEQFDLEITKTREAIKLANNEWLSFWAKAKELSRDDFTKEYEEANALWAIMILQGKEVHDFRQFAEFLEYHVPANLCCLYPEVKEILNELKTMGVHLILASSANTRHSTGV